MAERGVFSQRLDFALTTGDEAFLRGRLLDGIPGRRFQFRYFVPAILDLRENDFSACVRKVSAEVVELTGVGVVAGHTRSGTWHP